MTLEKDGYIERLIDKKVGTYLSVHGAISIEGAKWCGKTWTSLRHANTLINLDDTDDLTKAKTDLSYIFNDKSEKPILIDEWTRLPSIWDATRRQCDELQTKGNFILTCSTQPTTDEEKEQIFHSGAGRIGRITMRPMSLYESGNSDGGASLSAMLDNTQESVRTDRASIAALAEYCIRGGWPSNIHNTGEAAGILPRTYIDSLLIKDINRDHTRDQNRMLMLMRSLARNESSVANNQVLLRDVMDNETEEDRRLGRSAIEDYLDVLTRLYIIEEQPAFDINYRSSKRVGKTAKRHFVDPSLACALLGLNVDKLLSDLRTFGLIFESLAIRDLRVYLDAIGGRVFHFRDNESGDEVDAIAEFANGDYAAIEIKLGENFVDEAEASLLRFNDKVERKPCFMCVIVGNGDFVYRRQSGVYVVPICALTA